MPPPPNYIEAFVDYLRAEVNASPMTIHAYSVDLRAFVAYTEERLGEPFTPTEHDLDLVRHWLSHRLDTGSKASSVGKYLSSLKSYYRYCVPVSSGSIPSSPCVPPRRTSPCPYTSLPRNSIGSSTPPSRHRTGWGYVISCCYLSSMNVG